MEGYEDKLGEAIKRDFDEQRSAGRVGKPTVYSCPDCGGVLWEGSRTEGVAFRCHLGHAYSPAVLEADKLQAAVYALSSAARALVERATINRQQGSEFRRKGKEQEAREFEQTAATDERHVQTIEQLLRSIGG